MINEDVFWNREASRPSLLAFLFDSFRLVSILLRVESEVFLADNRVRERNLMSRQRGLLFLSQGRKRGAILQRVRSRDTAFLRLEILRTSTELDPKFDV